MPACPALLPRLPEACAAVLLVFALLTGCASVPTAERSNAQAERLPVLWVHGIDDHPGSFAPLGYRLREEGWTDLLAVRLSPNNGQVPLERLAYQIARAAARLRARTGAEHIDVVAFSMGALAARYWLQELEGHQRVRRFISISGPHHGTWMAWLFGEPGVAQMRPGSSFLQRLESSPRTMGHTEVYSFWSPLDTVIVPPDSSRLANALEERTFLVPLHPMMMGDPGVISSVVEVLSRPSLEPQPPTAEGRD